MPSLTRAEADARSALIAVTGYEVELDLTAAGGTFRSRTVVRFTAEPGAATFAELKPVRLESARLNGAALEPAAFADDRLALTGLAADNELVVEAQLAYTNAGVGLHRFTDPADGLTYVYAQAFLDDAQRIFACFDQPDLKAPVTLTVAAPPDWLVAANGLPAGPPEGGVWRFAPTRPLATYLVTLLAGPYHAVTAEHDGIPLALYCRRSLAAHLDADAAEILAVTRACLDRFHAMFDIRYPFGHYQQAFVPEFNAGAMENPGLVTFRDEFVFRSAVTDTEREQRATVIAHEMAHMWFGDLVTMRWWDDLWLNESFAEYLGARVSAEATRFTGAWTTFAMHRKAWGLRADQRPSTHPVAPAEVEDAARALLNFDGISYAKGAAVLKQLVAFVGDEAFLAGLNAHFAAHAFGNATLADLLTALSKASGRDLGGWADAWLRHAGVNTLRTRAEVGPDGRYTAVAVEQEAPAAYPTLRPHRVALGRWEPGDDAAVRRTDRVELDLDPAAPLGRTPVPALTGEPAAALLLLDDGDLTFAKIRLDDASAAAVPRVLPLLTDSLARAVVWASVLDAVVDAEQPVAELVTLVLAALPMETEVSIIEDVLATTRGLVDLYPTPEARPAALEAVAQACERLLSAAEPGGSRQLAAARGLIGATVDAGLLRGWLAGERVPAGLAVDTDLRWSVLYRLAVLGAAGPAEIDAELAADRSATGEQRATRCRAARPDPAAKEWAWAAVMRDGSLSNRLAEAAAEGFWQPEQLALTAGYVERYFADVPAVTTLRPGWAGEYLARLAYPRTAVADRTRELAAALLADPALDPVLRRVVTDADDDVRRALAARAV